MLSGRSLQTRTVSLSSNNIFILEDEDPKEVSPADTIFEMYPDIAEVTSMLSRVSLTSTRIQLLTIVFVGHHDRYL